MDHPAHPQTGQEPPAGEYVVVEGAPFPEKLDRRFRTAAVIIGSGVAITTAILLAVGVPASPSRKLIAEIGLGVLGSGGLAYTVVRIIGMLAVAATGLRRSKTQYAVEWQETPRGDGWSREKATVLLVLFVILAAIASHR